MWRESAESPLGSLLVIFAPLLLDQRSGLQQIREQVFVQAFVAKPTVEGFDVRVLVRFARLDQTQTHASRVRQATIALPQNSLPLSVRITFGKPRLSANRS